MGALTEEEKQARLAELKKIPAPVRMATLIAFALGLVTFLRILARSYAMHLPLGKGAFYGFLFLGWCFIAGVSLYARSRWGYLGLLALTLVPLLGLFTLSVHLLRLMLEGNLTTSWPETIHCALALGQLAVTCVLLRYVLTRQTREFVWKRSA